MRDGQYTRDVPPEEQAFVEKMAREGALIALPYGYEPSPFGFEPLSPPSPKNTKGET